MLGCGQSLWDFVLQPPGEARGVIQCTLLPYVPGDVCPGQSDLTGPWEDVAEASVTGVRHRCRAQDERWGDRAGSGVVVTPDVGRAPWVRMARRDIPQRWTMKSPSDAFWCHRGMECDVTEAWIVTRCPSLLIFGRRVSASRLVPALQLSEFVRSGVLSEAFGAGVVLGELFVAALRVQRQSRQRIFPSPALPGSGSRGTQEARSQQQR